MTAHIAYNNRVFGAFSITATSTKSLYFVDSASEWSTYEYWVANAPGSVYYTVDVGTSVDATVWGVAFHDLSDRPSTPYIQAQYSANGSAWGAFSLAYYPTNNRILLREGLAPVDVRYYRFLISSSTTASRFGNFFIGETLALPNDIEPPFLSPLYSHNVELKTNVSETGYFLGRTRYTGGVDFTIKQNYVTEAWMDANWDNLINHIELYPFYFIWDLENRPDDVIFAWTRNISNPTYVTSNLLSFSIECSGRYI